MKKEYLINNGTEIFKEYFVNLQAETLFSLRGKTVLLTGASGFLGRTMGTALIENGAKLIAIGRSEKIIEQGGKWASQFGSDKVATYQVDMYDIPLFEKKLDEIVKKEGFIDVLVNNAHELNKNTGFNTPEGSLDNATHDQWMRNLTGGIYWSVLTTQKIGQEMKSHNKGSIINISTMYAIVAPNPQLYEGTQSLNPPGYSASKAGLLSFTRYTASFWGKYGIRANAILPGPFSNTEEEGPNSVKTGDFFIDRLKERTCLGRIGSPKELIGALIFLSSDASSYMTGQALVIDGGWTIT
jgi:NAD(P)-dependent dehydrogenase (short-subunit alcohol dehydrogenase family)